MLDPDGVRVLNRSRLLQNCQIKGLITQGGLDFKDENSGNEIGENNGGFSYKFIFRSNFVSDIKGVKV